MEISGPVEPGLVIETGHVDDQRLSFPSASRVSHPRIDGTLEIRPIHVEDAAGARELVSDEDVLRSLNDLKRKGHVRGPRYTRHITLDLRVLGQPGFEVLLLF